MGKANTISDYYVALTVVATTSVQTINELIRARLASISKSLPAGRIIQIRITPTQANMRFRDGHTADVQALAVDTTKTFPTIAADEQIALDTSAATATCQVEIFIEKQN